MFFFFCQLYGWCSISYVFCNRKGFRQYAVNFHKAALNFDLRGEAMESQGNVTF